MPGSTHAMGSSCTVPAAHRSPSRSVARPRTVSGGYRPPAPLGGAATISIVTAEADPLSSPGPPCTRPGVQNHTRPLTSDGRETGSADAPDPSQAPTPATTTTATAASAPRLDLTTTPPDPPRPAPTHLHPP